ANTSPLNTSPTNDITPDCGLPTYGCASVELSGAPAALNSPATPDLDERLPPVPTSDPTSTTASEVEPNSQARDANVSPFPATGIPISGASQSERTQAERTQVEQVRSCSTSGDPVIGHSPETMEPEAGNTGEVTSANNAPASEAIPDSVPSGLLETISDERFSVSDAEGAISGVVDEAAAGRERPSPSMARLAEMPASVRFAFEEYRQLITSNSSKGTDEFPSDEFGRGSTPQSSSNGSDFNRASMAADALPIDFEKFAHSRSHDPDRTFSSEHRMQEQSVSATSAPLSVVHPRQLSATSAGAVSDQLAAAIVERLDAGHDSSPSTFRLRLDPRELGTVEVHLSIVHDVVSIRFVAQDEAARQVIERQLDDLRQSLTNSGVSFGQCHVGCNSDGRHSSDQQQAAPPAISRTPPVLSRWSRHQDHEVQVTLPQGRLNVVA
ncbi:MAG: flagellar hook-length control protein FliK, partial [Planctomycetaceae bacterium]|nr:flagellar hook-length control protein FliK [Planctomycetaceae bacterium]